MIVLFKIKTTINGVKNVIFIVSNSPVKPFQLYPAHKFKAVLIKNIEVEFFVYPVKIIEAIF